MRDLRGAGPQHINRAVRRSGDGRTVRHQTAGRGIQHNEIRLLPQRVQQCGQMPGADLLAGVRRSVVSGQQGKVRSLHGDQVLLPVRLTALQQLRDAQ